MMGSFRSIRNEILIKVIFILVFSICASVAYNYFAGTALAIANASKSIQKLNSSIIFRSTSYLLDSNNIAQRGANLVSKGFLSNTFEAALDYMFDVLKTSAVTHSLSVGLEKGFYMSLSKISKESDKIEDIPENAAFILRVIKNGFSDSEIQETFYDKNQIEIPFKPNKKNFSVSDFRKLFWYSKSFESNEACLSDIHVHSEQNLPCITASIPVHDNNKQKIGVFAASISTQELSSFINDMLPTDYSNSFIVDNDRKIIASSDLEKTTVHDKQNNISIITSKNLTDNTLDMALNQYKSDLKGKDLDENIFYFKNDKANFIVSINNFPISVGLNWRLVSITPSSVFTVDAFNIQQNSIYLAVVILLIAMFMVYFEAQKLSEPIKHLAIEAKKIQSLDLGDIMFLNSDIAEIRELTDTMEASKRNLQNFSKYVPKGLVKQFIESQEEVEIGGSTKEITIMFTDVANFTTVSESMSPQELMIHISDYFDNLTNIIIENNGTVDKFIGDAIMAFWGAPVANANQTIDACRTALLCQQSLNSLNNFWKESGKAQLVTRFGINFGNAVIGNVGSSERMNYTAIGDTVNLGARLEGINKMYGTNVIISDSAYERLNPNFIVRPLDVVTVKGKSNHTKIYELVGIKDDKELYPIPEKHVTFCENFTTAFDFYLEGNWAKAKKAFELLNTLNQKELHYQDILIPVYIKRCADFIKNPPKNGVFEARHLDEK